MQQKQLPSIDSPKKETPTSKFEPTKKDMINDRVSCEMTNHKIQ